MAECGRDDFLIGRRGRFLSSLGEQQGRKGREGTGGHTPGLVYQRAVGAGGEVGMESWTNVRRRLDVDSTAQEPLG